MFQIGGPLWRFLSLLGDMVIIHVVWLICCLPVVTFGPATVAAHYVAMKIVRDEGRGVIREFFKSFKQNFRQGLVLGILFLFVGGFLGLDFYLCIEKMEASNMFKFVMLAALCVLTILYLFEFLYIWAVVARFENTIKQTIINAFFIAMSHMRETSVMLAQDLLLIIVAIVCYAFFPQAFVVFTLFGIPLWFVLNSRKLRKVMDEYLPEDRKRLEKE